MLRKTVIGISVPPGSLRITRKAIFDGAPRDQRLFAQIIGTIYPKEISTTFLSRIETASPARSKQAWHDVRNAIETGAPPMFAPDRSVRTLRTISDAREKIRADLLSPSSSNKNRREAQSYLD